MTSINVTEVMQKASHAADKLKSLSQEQIDKIVENIYKEAYNNRIHLAKMAHNETGIGKWEDKVFKNVVASHFVYNDIKDLKTTGIISEDKESGIIEIAQPLGPIFVITPVTNPTSTVLFKILIALKTRNPIVISPHGAARKSSIEAAKICYNAAIDAGAPENSIQWIKRASKEEILEFMGHRKTAMILATGSVKLVNAAYSSGNPAIGVGPGNVPVFVGKTADIDYTVKQVIKSKTFDNGTVCASEQALILQKFNAVQVIEKLKEQKAYFMFEDEIKKVEEIAFNKHEKVMNAQVIGQSAYKIAQLAGFNVPEETTVLVAQLSNVGLQSPLSLEILAPILALYVVEDLEEAILKCKEINKHGGLGHTVSIFSNNLERINYFASQMNAGRVIVNTPSSQGALGGTYNFLQPSLTLACGAGGKNITTDNISARHLLNIQRIAFKKESECLKHFNENVHLDHEIDADKLVDCCRMNNC
jgi:acetaldehyde dehydrogenase / alcohol dehydrogenase